MFFVKTRRVLSANKEISEVRYGKYASGMSELQN
jgi:hypothetical protein